MSSCPPPAVIPAVVLHSKPKVNLSSYNIFFLTERKRILNGMDEASSRARPFTKEEVEQVVAAHKQRGKRAHRKAHGVISFEDLTLTIAGRWKRVDAESERIVNDQAKHEKRLYKEKNELWKQYEEGIESSGRSVDRDTQGTETGSPSGAGASQDAPPTVRKVVSLESLGSSSVNESGGQLSPKAQQDLQAFRNYIDQKIGNLLNAPTLPLWPENQFGVASSSTANRGVQTIRSRFLESLSKCDPGQILESLYVDQEYDPKPLPTLDSASTGPVPISFPASGVLKPTIPAVRDDILLDDFVGAVNIAPEPIAPEELEYIFE